MPKTFAKKSGCCNAPTYKLCECPEGHDIVRCEKCHTPVAGLREEVITILDNLKKANMRVSANSFDYRKGVNDAQWFYHIELNKIITALKNETQI
jgi:hypothetical protein